MWKNGKRNLRAHNLFQNNRFGRKLFAYLLLLTIVPVILISVISYNKQKAFVNKEVQDELQVAGDNAYSVLSAYFEERFLDLRLQSMKEENLKILKEFESAFRQSNAGLKEFTRSLLWSQVKNQLCSDLKRFQINYSYPNIFIADANGNILYSASPRAYLGENLFEGELAQTKLSTAVKRSLKTGAAAYADLDYITRDRQNLECYIAQAMVDQNGERKGVIIFELPVEEIYQVLSANYKHESEESYLIGRDLFMMSRSRFLDDSESILLKKIDTEIGMLFQDYLQNPDLREETQFGSMMAYKDYRDVPVLGVLRMLNIDETHYGIITEIDKAEAYRAISSLRLTIILITAAVIFIMIITLAYITTKVTNPILQLNKWVREVAKGKMGLMKINAPKDEIGDMSKGFSELVDTLNTITHACKRIASHDYSVELKERSDEDQLTDAVNQMSANLIESSIETERKISYLNNIPTTVYVIDKEYHVKFINKKGKELLGLRDDSWQSKKCYELFETNHCHDRSCAAAKAMSSNNVCTEECQVGKMNKLNVRYTAAPLMEQGQNTGTVIYQVDITDEIKITELAESISKGNFEKDIQLRSEKDRLGIALQDMTSVLRGITQFAERLATGDTSVKVKEQSEKDQLANSMNKMVDAMNQAAMQADIVAQGDYTARFQPRSQSDRLGLALKAMTETLAKSSEENVLNDWMKTGETQLALQLRGYKDVYTIAKDVIAFLAKYLGCLMGAFYVKQGSDVYKLAGSYAFKRRKSLSTEIKSGSGLVGQAALEGELILATDVPSDYIRIESGLGNAVPKNILAFPISLQNETIAVIELASFQEFEKNALDFLASVSESIFIALRSAQENERTKELLEETQRQAEELEEQTQILNDSQAHMEAQQEELKTNNELLEKQKHFIETKNSELEELAAKLQKKSDELEETGKYKSEFLANMSHELRTPLNSIILLSKNLGKNKKGNLSDQQVNNAQIIYNSGEELLQLINDILDISKIEAGKMDLALQEIGVQEIKSYVQDSFGHLMAEKGLSLEVSINANAPNSFVSDRQRLCQVLKNLLSNALKFTHKGGVHVEIYTPDADAKLKSESLNPKETFAIAVSDTGIGIAEDKQKIIFNAFQQENGSTSRTYGGTGLGLSISRELVKLLGGEIQLKSTLDKGSKFIVYLKKHLVAQDKQRTEDLIKVSQEGVPKKSVFANEENEIPLNTDHVDDDRDSITEDDKVILVVDDDLNYARELYKLCIEKDCKCIHASSGEDAIYLAHKFKPLGILLDLILPGMDGLQVLDELKDHYDTREIPIHVISKKKPEKVLESLSVEGYSQKPVGVEEIKGTLANMISLANKANNILIIEDDKNLQEALKASIAHENVHLLFAKTGAEGLKQLSKHDVALVILDLTLPDASGTEILQKIHNMNKELAVIVYTGKELTGEEEEVLAKYARAVVLKKAAGSQRLLDEVSLFLHSIVNHSKGSSMRNMKKHHEKEISIEGKTVLTVDDDVRNLYSLEQELKELGLKVKKAANGEMALKSLKGDKEVDLVLMDIMMPIMDGYQAIEKIREDPAIAKTPIIAVTAKALKEDREKCIKVGANDYLSKPIDMDQLINLIKVWIRK